MPSYITKGEGLDDDIKIKVDDALYRTEELYLEAATKGRKVA